MLEKSILNKLALILLIFFAALFIFSPEKKGIILSHQSIYVSKRKPLNLSFCIKKLFFKRCETNIQIMSLPDGYIEVIKRKKDFLIFYNTNIIVSSLILVVNYKGKEFSTNVGVDFLTGDFDRDGYPDFMEEIDRKSFRDWFCSIAESQFYYPSDEWYDVHKDCAGLIEFAFKMALMRHDENWVRKFKYLCDVSIPDNNIFYYPDIPFLGKKIFRIREGFFDINNIEKDFSESASGSVLKNYSMKFLGRDYRMAEKGDIFFFFNTSNLKMPSHSMIFVKDRESYFIYHTGPDVTNKGMVKKVFLEELLNHPELEWRPVPQNKNFLGIYRWKILD